MVLSKCTEMRTLVLTLIICLGLGSVSLAKVNLLGTKSINAAFSNPTFDFKAPNGTNRVLIVTIANEYINSIDYNITSITYGGVAMQKMSDVGVSSLISRNEIEAYYLLDSSLINASDSSIVIIYNLSSMLSLNEANYNAFVFENVDQNAPFISLSTNTATSTNSIATTEMYTDANDGIFSMLASSDASVLFNASSGFSNVNQTAGSAMSESIAWFDSYTTQSTTPAYTAAGNAGRVVMLSFGLKSNMGTPLPVKLTHFEATVKDERFVNLTWITQSEQNSDYFMVEKSFDFRNWETIEKVAAAGNSNARITYSADDYNTTAGITYYRLTQVDFDGESKTYDPVSVELTTENTLSIYPNPAQETLHISGLNWANQGVQLSTIKGDVILARVKGNTIDVSNLSNGIYFLNLNNQTHKFVVAR